MEKQRCARAAALSGKSLDCPGCNDPNQECSLHHVPGKNGFFSYSFQPFVRYSGLIRNLSKVMKTESLQGDRALSRAHEMAQVEILQN